MCLFDIRGSPKTEQGNKVRMGLLFNSINIFILKKRMSRKIFSEAETF